MKKKLLLAGIAILLVGCQSKGAGWPMALNPSVPSPAPLPPQNPPPPNTSDQNLKPSCALNFDRSLNLKQIALQAALIYQKCKLTEEQVMAIMDPSLDQNSNPN